MTDLEQGGGKKRLSIYEKDIIIFILIISYISAVLLGLIPISIAIREWTALDTPYISYMAERHIDWNLEEKKFCFKTKCATSNILHNKYILNQEFCNASLEILLNVDNPCPILYADSFNALNTYEERIYNIKLFASAGCLILCMDFIILYVIIRNLRKVINVIKKIFKMD